MEQEGALEGGQFLGEFRHTLDPKGRLILPATFREALSEGLVMTVGLDNCLTVHPVADWQRVVAGLRHLRTTDRRGRVFSPQATPPAPPGGAGRRGPAEGPA